MAGEGAALGRGIILGRQALSSGTNLGPVISLAGRSPVTSSTVRPQGVTQRKSPAEIRSLAAAQVLEEKKLALLEKQHALEERKLNMVEQQAREKRLNDYYNRTETMGIQRRKETNAAQDRATAASDKAYESGRRVSAVGKADLASAQKDAYAMAKAGLQSGNSEPLLDYFDRFGSPNMSITSMEFTPGQEDGPISVKFSNGGATTFKNKGQALLMLLAPTNPDYAGVVAQRKEDREERKVVAKEKEVDIKAGAGKTITPKQMADYNQQAMAQYQKDWGDPMGGFNKDAPPREQYMKDYVGALVSGNQGPLETGKKLAPQAATGITPPGKQTDAKDTTAPAAEQEGVKTLRNKKTGEVVKVYPDGRRETVTPAVEGKATYSPGKAKVTMGRGAEYKQSIQKPEEKKEESEATGIPTEKKDQARKQGTASYKDKQGNTVTVSVDAKGNLTRNVTESKKKKKKKKKTGK